MARLSVKIPHCILTLLFASLAFGLGGCQPFDFYDASANLPLAPESMPPSELNRTSLPPYRIEPPDVVQVEMIKQVPKPPYRAQTYDVLQIQVVGAFPDQPIANFYLVEAEGTVNLGPAYGSVYVAGMTINEIQAAIRGQLMQVLNAAEVSVQLARSAGTQPVTGEYLVAPDGTINLRQYGLVNVAGKTMAEATQAMQKQLSQYFESPEVSLSVLAYNSKVYYIITQGANLGDNIVRVPVTGSETVLDAIANVGGLSQLSSKQIWIARPAPAEVGCEQVMKVDWDAIAYGASTATNYQIMPDDRIYIAEDGVVSVTNFLAKVLAPIERIAGATSLGASTIRGTQTMGRGYNKNRY